MKFKEFTLEIKTGEEKLSESESKVYELLVPRHKASAIKIEEFSDLYGEEVIKRDKEYVEKKKAGIKERGTSPTKRAEILEAILSEQIELSNWLGQEAETIIPSEYDDSAHGVDVAVEFEGAEGFKHMALGVDFTSSAEQIKKKLLKAKKHILKDDLTEIKYFISEKSHIRKKLSKIPWLIVGADTHLLRELSKLWIAKYQPPSATGEISEETQKYLSEQRKNAQKELANHRMQNLLLDELEMELVAFMEFANKNNREEIANKYEALLDLIRNIRADKEQMQLSGADQSKNENDLVFKALKKELAEIFA